MNDTYYHYDYNVKKISLRFKLFLSKFNYPI
jgi:hypothetical protein